MEHVLNLLEKRTKKCPNTICRCENKLENIEDCNKCINNARCKVEEFPIICNDCLHDVLEREFANWSSENLLIDKFIRRAQRSLSYIKYPEWIPYNFFTEIKYINKGELGAVISAKWSQGVKIMQSSNDERYYIRSKSCAFPEWIPYDSLTEIKFINRGGFGAVYSAKWVRGVKCLSMIDGDKYYTRSDSCTVAIKQLKSEKDSIHLFLKEIQAQFNCCHLYGVTKDPSTSQYMFIMRYAPQGDLRRFLQKNFDKLTLDNKLNIAQSICLELQNIHAKGWVHGDLHSGNILLLNEEDVFISDFGLCRPINETKMPEKKIYGVIPNIAPEILLFQSPYSQAGDIYSLGIILWELACGIPAFSNRAHCVNLISDICNGLRPTTCHFAPPTYNDLLKRCWVQNPLERPTINLVLDSIKLLCTYLRYTYEGRLSRHSDEGNRWAQKRFKFVSLSGHIEEMTLDEYRSKNPGKFERLEQGLKD
ncbi:11884_t:CDS:2, partial [Racocetra fulgida]